MQERKPTLINKAFNRYLWASVLTVAATQIANIIDATIVGNLVSADGLAAVNLSKPLLQAFFAVTCLYVASSTILAGMVIGKGDRKAADKLFSFAVSLSLVLGLLFTTAGMIWFHPLSRAICQSETLRPLCDAFMRITLISAAPQMLMLTLQQFVTMDGDPKMVSRAVIVGNILNILMDIAFIKFFRWGIAGAACATCVMYLACILMVLPHFRKKGSLRFTLTKPGEVALGKIFSIGLPLFLSTVLISVQYMGNNYVASRYMGDDGLVTLAVCVQMFAFSMIILNGTLRAEQPVGAILRGMEDHMGMMMLMKRSYRFMIVCFLALAVLLILFPVQIGSMLGVSSPSALDMIQKALPLFTLHIVAQGLICNLLPVFQLYERKGLALLLSVVQALLPMVFFLLLRGHWIGFFVGQVVTGLAILIWTEIIRHKGQSLSRILLIPVIDGTKVLELTVQPDTQSLSQAIMQLRSFLTSNGKTPHTVHTAAICAEEFVNNIIRHGKASSIDLGVTDSSDSVTLSIHDDGIAFDPVIAVKASDNRIGLGLTIATAFSKDISYKYIFNQNMVTVKIPNEEPQ